MNERLVKVLGATYKAEEWVRFPVEAWHNFSVKDMHEMGYYTKVCSWFNKLSDNNIREMYNGRNGIKRRRESTYQLIDELGN